MRAFAWLLFVLVLGYPNLARAKDLVLQLGSAEAPAPSHLCVASAWSRALTEEEAKLVPRMAAVAGELTLVPDDPKSHSTPDPRPDRWPGEELTRRLLSSRAPAGEVSSCGVWRTGAGSSSPEGECSAPKPYAGACALTVPSGQLEPTDKLSCRWNDQAALTQGRFGVVVLRFEGAKILDFGLTGNVARVRLDSAPSEKDRPPIVRVIGGHYLSEVGVPITMLEGTQIVPLRLTPRCEPQQISVPKYRCSQGRTGDELVRLTASDDFHVWVSRKQLAGGSIEVPNGSAGYASLTLAACDGVGGRLAHEFRSQWGIRQREAIRELRPRRVEFTWERDPLSEPGQCPCSAELPEQGLTCSLVSKQRQGGDAGRCWLESADEVCAYQCPGGAERAELTLPTKVVFVEKRKPWDAPPECRADNSEPTDDRRWELWLGHAGQSLRGFVKEAERELELEWEGWCGAAQDASTLWGERIDYVVLGTSDGRTFRVRPWARHVRVPRLQAGDLLTVSFEGERTFNIDEAKVENGGRATVVHPAEARRPKDRSLRADRLVFSGALAGGLRRISNGGGPTSWNPYGEVNVLATIRELRIPTLATRRKLGGALADVYFEPELRVGMIFTTNAYSSSFASTTFVDRPRWENVLALMFPLEVLLHFFGQQPFHFAFGAGTLLSREMYASDAERLSKPALFSLAGNAGLSLMPMLAIDFDFRQAFGNETVERQFDDAGISSSRVHSGGLTFIGVRLRFDDWFRGTRTERPTPSQRAELGRGGRVSGAHRITGRAD